MIVFRFNTNIYPIYTNFPTLTARSHTTWICLRTPRNNKKTYGYGSIPINAIFSGMNIHLPAILMFTRGTRFDTLPYILKIPQLFFSGFPGTSMNNHRLSKGDGTWWNNEDHYRTTIESRWKRTLVVDIANQQIIIDRLWKDIQQIIIL